MSVWGSVGGSASVAALASSIARGDVVHAWLLLGPAGAGKRQTATCMAAALDCPEMPGEGCGKCSTCLRILRHRHPDVHHIVPEGPLIPVDTIREQVLVTAARSPFEARLKVFIIEEAERMNPSAQNALLKTLEEPHADTVFVLISDREEELLDTVRSRCRSYRLEPVSEDIAIDLLEAEGASPEAARLAARVAAGDLPRARTLVFSESERTRRSLWLSIPSRLTDARAAFDVAAEILEEARAAVAERAVAQKKEVAELAEAMGEGRGTATARNALAKRHKRELKRLEEDVVGDALATLASFYRDVIAMRSGGDESIVNLDMIEQLRPWSATEVSDRYLSLAIERLLIARSSFVRNANLTLAVESAMIEVCRLVPPPVRVGAAS